MKGIGATWTLVTDTRGGTHGHGLDRRPARPARVSAPLRPAGFPRRREGETPFGGAGGYSPWRLQFLFPGTEGGANRRPDRDGGITSSSPRG